MADVITRLKVESSEYDAKIQRASKSLADMTHQAEVNGNKIATANKENIALAQSLGKMQTVATSVRGKMSELTAAFENATHSYNRLTAAEKNSPFGRALKGSVDQLQARIKSLRTEMQTTQSQLGKTGGMGIGAQFGQGLSSAAAMFGPAAIAIGGVTAAVSGMKKVMGDMIQINMQFEQSTANLASVMGKSRDEISDLTNQAKQLGATTQYTAIQITGLQENLARLGFTQNEILNSTKAVQAFATATGADLSEAATVAGAALRAFQMPATEMDRVASVLAVSTTKSALSFEKLATALPIVSPVAKQFGFTIEDTVTLLGKLSDAGFDASSAATATRNIFLNMANSSGKLAQALGRPIRSIEDLAPAMVELKNKGIDLADMLALTDKRSVAAFATFLDSAGTMTQFKDSITDCGDALDDMVNERLNTLEGSVTIMKSAWEGLMLTFSSSNGVLKSVTDALTRLIAAYTNARKRAQGGDEAIATFENGVSKKEQTHQKALVQRYRNAGYSDEDIAKKMEETKSKLEDEEAELRRVYDLWQKRYELIKSGKSGLAKGAEFDELKGMSNTTDVRDNLLKQIAEVRDKMAAKDYAISLVTKVEVEDPNGGEGGGAAGEKAAKSELARQRALLEAKEKERIASLEREKMSEEEYADAVYEIEKSTLEQIANLYNEDTKEYAQVMAKKSQLDIQYQATKMRLAQKAQREEEQQRKKEEREKEQALRKQQQLDNHILSGMNNKAKSVGWTSADLGTTGIKTKIEAGIDITEEEWTALQDKLNARLQSMGLDPVQINFETGNLEQVIDQSKAAVNKMMSDFSNGVGAVGSLVGALDNLKNVGDDLAAVFSGEMDAWDSLMTVLNSGLSILQTVTTVYEAINTLTEIGTALKMAHAAAATTEATSEVTAATTEVAAEGSVAAAAGTATAAKAGEAAAGAGSAMSGIPFVGPILAVAAIAAVLAAVMAAVSKSKSANSYATGGIVGGNSPSGDNVISFLNSGEGVLTKQGVANAGALMENDGLANNLHLSTDVSGTNLRIVLDNDNRSKGGSRGAYSRIK